MLMQSAKAAFNALMEHYDELVMKLYQKVIETVTRLRQACCDVYAGFSPRFFFPFCLLQLRHMCTFLAVRYTFQSSFALPFGFRCPVLSTSFAVSVSRAFSISHFIATRRQTFCFLLSCV